MITPFSKRTQVSVVPSRYGLRVFRIVLTILMLLYIVTFSLYLVLLFQNENTAKYNVSIVISVLEIIVTFSSIVISVVATRISDSFSNACVGRIEYYNRQNAPFLHSEELVGVEDEVRKSLNTAGRLKVVVIIVFAVYLIGSIVWHIYNRLTILQLLTFVFGAVSAIFSIILALVSVISCVETGKYTDTLLNALYEDNKRLVDMCNNYSISKK